MRDIPNELKYQMDNNPFNCIWRADRVCYGDFCVFVDDYILINYQPFFNSDVLDCSFISRDLKFEIKNKREMFLDEMLSYGFKFERSNSLKHYKIYEIFSQNKGQIHSDLIEKHFTAFFKDDLDMILKNQILSPRFIAYHIKSLSRDLVLLNQKIPLNVLANNIDLLTNNDKKLKEYMCRGQVLTEKFIEKYTNYVNWRAIGRFQNLSLAFISKYSHFFAYEDFAYNKKISEELKLQLEQQRFELLDDLQLILDTNYPRDLSSIYKIVQLEKITKQFILENIERFYNTEINILLKKDTSISSDIVGILSSKLGWKKVTSYMDDFKTIKKYENEISLANLPIKDIVKKQDLPEEWIENHIKEINFLDLFKYQKVSEEFLNKYKDSFTSESWEIIATYQDLSQNFVIQNIKNLGREALQYQNISDYPQKFINRIRDWDTIAKNKKLSGEFLEINLDNFKNEKGEFIDSFLKNLANYPPKFVERHFEEINWKKVVLDKNNRLSSELTSLVGDKILFYLKNNVSNYDLDSYIKMFFKTKIFNKNFVLDHLLLIKKYMTLDEFLDYGSFDSGNEMEELKMVDVLESFDLQTFLDSLDYGIDSIKKSIPPIILDSKDIVKRAINQGYPEIIDIASDRLKNDKYLNNIAKQKGKK